MTKICLISESKEIQNWQYLSLRKVIAKKLGEVVFHIILNNKFFTRPANRLSLAVNNKIFNFYTKHFERHFFPVDPDASSFIDATDLLQHPTNTASFQILQVNDHDFSCAMPELSGHRFDIAVNFTFFSPSLFSRLGISGVYYHTINNLAASMSSCSSNSFKRDYIVNSKLIYYENSSKSDHVIINSNSALDRFSLVRSYNKSMCKTASFLSRALANSAHTRLNSDSLHKTFSQDFTAVGTHSVKFHQIGKQVTKYLGTKLTSKVSNRFFRNQWALFYRFDHKVSYHIYDYRKLTPPSGTFWADPFIFFYDGQYYIFFEEYLDNKGHISYITLDSGGSIAGPFKILDKPYHLSYPFLFEYDRDIYMTPESSGNQTIDLYKADIFPHTWNFVKSIKTNLRALDPTLLFYDSKWWLFVNIAENPGSSGFDELFLFYSNSPIDDSWTAHPLNPIISDCRKARPGGNLFTFDGKLFRPSQDCSRAYGYGLRINQVNKLSTSDYQESEIAFLEPIYGRSNIGIHHISHNRGLTVLDSNFRVFNKSRSRTSL